MTTEEFGSTFPLQYVLSAFEHFAWEESFCTASVHREREDTENHSVPKLI